MSITFKFYGTKQEESVADVPHLQSLHPNLKVVEYTSMAARSGLSKPVEIKADEKDVIEMKLSNDVIWHYRADDFKTLLERQSTSRGGDANELRVPESFITEDENRGLPKFLVTQSVRVITGWAAQQTAIALANKLEEKLALGVHYCNEKMEFFNFDRTKTIANKPYLLFIHGTNSSTFGAFQTLIFNDAYKKLFTKYEGRIIAFEHKTLSESPLKNLVELLTQLPDNISLDVVSHSRGGIIADLLARCNNGDLPFNNDEVKTVANNPDLLILKQEVDAANKAATNKKILINKVVRVACPAAGTVLIGKKLDNYVNVFCNLIKLIPGAAQAIPLTIFLDFAKAVVQERTDLKALPGLEAQMPDSPFMKLLNNGIRKITSELYVISGDVESSGFWNSLKVFGTNLYFGEAHDLVVNSNSMFKGTYRSSIVKEHFEQQSNVNHFNYFKNVSSQNALLTVLTNPATTAEFFAEIGATADIHIVHERGIADIGKKPMVFLLPGIMGSNLTVKEKSVWTNYSSICTGGLEKLQISAQKVNATSLHEGTYNNLINYLSSDFDVMPFPYDWRISVTESAAILADTIQKALKDPDRTCYDCHFIAHSMGGLVLRAMMHLHSDIWNKVISNRKTRVIMMGVPNEGSYGTIRILLGKDAIIKKLALLDFVHSKEFLISMFQDYPGLIQLLPANNKDIFGTKIWNDLKTNNDEFTGTPPLKTLANGTELFKTIKDTDFNNDIFRYVAGQDDDTPDSIDLKDGKITFTASSQGDGRVLWSTIPAALLPANIYYVPADHGSIPTYEDAFEGYKELLTKGSTALLSNIKPSIRSTNVSRVMPDSDFVTVPTENEIKSSNIVSIKEKVRKKLRPQTIQVSVTNSDLIHSKYPVVVGHFMGDGIVKAEKFLNLAVNLKLSEYHTTGNYPGAIGSHLVILKENNGFDENLACQGAVVVGLGEFGALTQNSLLLSLTQAFLTLAIRHNEYLKNNKAPAGSIPEFGISSLLIGSDFAGLRIDTSIKAILTAVIQTNEKLEAMNSEYYKKINRIEIVEIYQHKAIQVGRIINKFMKEDRFANFKFLPPFLNPIPGFLRLIPDESQQDNWNRLEVTVVKKGDTANTISKRSLPLLFTSITDKAHADEQLLPTNRLIVESLISEMAKYAKWDKSFSQTLYELLIPNNFKGYGSSLGNIVLIVDEETARYPWELLHDPNGISNKPMVVSTGMVRQLKTPDQRTTATKLNNSNRVLVIGNPDTNEKYPDLPAAEKEAQAVVNILQGKGLETTISIKENDTAIVKKLLTLSYKIIHIASHGIVGSTIDEPTGVVIGSDIVFTAADFNQISIVPEFVFINVCSSDEFNISIAQKMRKKYDLAASVGTQLIQMGVRAAIVTGWEINDAAAAEFARDFYTQMMDGKGFGDSVHFARESTYNKYGAFNTWGAYQCYGDPFYTFPSPSGSAKSALPSYVDTVEVMYALENLDNSINSAIERTANKDYKTAIENISNGLQAGWDKDPGIVEMFATVYTSLQQFDTAIQYYQKLFTLEDAGYTVKSVERYCNIRVRHAAKQFKDNIISKPAAIKTIKEAINDLKKILGTSFERYSLIAGAYRRLFEVDNDINGSLKEAARYYQVAYQYHKQTADELPYYPYFNWLHIAIMLSSSKNKEPHLKIPLNRKELDNEALANAEDENVKNPTFFHKTARCSFHLAELLSAKTGDVKKYVDEMEIDYNRAWATSGKLTEKDSFIGYLRFIITLLAKSPAADTKETRDMKAAALKELVDKIS